jgi:hypothetical protein
MPSNNPVLSSNRKRKESFAMPPYLIIFYNDITSDSSKFYYHTAHWKPDSTSVPDNGTRKTEILNKSLFGIVYHTWQI